MIYLDHAATTPPCAEAVEAVSRAMRECWGNPSATHAPGREAHNLLEESRRQVLKALGTREGTLVFTSGGTEADNLAIRSGLRRGHHVISSAAEHDAILNSLKALKDAGAEVTLLKPDACGRISAEQVAEALRPDTALISLMLVNNETGAVNDIAAVRRLLVQRGSQALLHTDAVQAFRKLPFTPEKLGADMISLSAHKIRGPKGAGALWIRKGLHLAPILYGGGQEGGLRSGTEGMPAIAGFGAACAASGDPAAAAEHYRALRAAFLAALPEAVLNGDPDVCAGHNVSISMPGCRAEVLQNRLDSLGICVSRGSACAKGKRSHVLEAAGLPAERIDSALRISFGPETTEAEVLACAEALREAQRQYFPKR